MTRTVPLPIALANRVEQLCQEGEAFAAESRFNAATLRFTTAFRLLPRPQDKWQITPRLLASVVDTCFAKRDFTSAREATLAALECPGVSENPALRLKLGEIYYESGDFTSARAEFAFALEHGGEDVFEDEDPKYWEFATGENHLS